MNPQFNYNQFEADLFEATAECYQDFTKKREREGICAFALYSDESASSISASVNVRKHLDKVTKEDPDDPLYYKWSSAEWKYESIEGKKLDQLSKRLMEVATNISDEDFTEHKTQVFEKCVSVLQRHKQEGLFSNVANGFILMFDVSDYSNVEQQIQWIKSMNDAKSAEEFHQVVFNDE